MLKKFDNIPKELNKKCVDEVITRIEEIESERVGEIAAQDIIDIVVENLGPEIYNTALRDTKKLVRDRLDDLDYEIDGLEQAR